MEPVERRVRQLLHDDGWSITPDDDAVRRVHTGARRRRQRRTAVASGVTVAALAVGTGGIVWTTTQPDPQDSTVAVTADDDEGRSHDGGSDQDTSSDQGEKPSTTMGQVEPRRGGTGQPLPSRFDAASVTATSPRQMWVLGGDPSAETATVARTNDGGGSFIAAGTISADVATGDNELGPQTVRDIRFGSKTDGWAYGGSLWSTHDAGQTWQPSTGVEGEVVQLATTADQTVALARHNQTWSLWHTPTDADDWSRLDERIGDPGDLVAAGTTIALSDRTDDGAEVIVSTDGGQTFDRRTSPCSSDLGAGRLSATNEAIWMLCATGTAGQLHVSTDDGQGWQPANTEGTTLPNSGEVGARSDSAAVVSLPGETVNVDTEDPGATDRTPRAVNGLGSPRYVGFTTEQVGYLLDQSGRLFRTSDGGAHWRKLTVR